MRRPRDFTRTAAIITAFIGLATAGAVAKVKVQTKQDPSFDFGRARTWAWHASGPGEVKMAVTADDNPEAVRSRAEPVIVQTVEEELARRGWQKATEGEPDVRLTYYLLIGTAASTQEMGQFIPGTLEWGLPPFSGATTSFKVIHRGSLVLDVIDPKPGNVVWRSIGQAELHLERTTEERTERLRDAVREMLKKFPQKK